MIKRYWWATGLAFLIALMIWNRASAAELSQSDPDPDDGRWVGLVSTQAECVSVPAGSFSSVSTQVRLQWEGDLEQAFLELSVTGSQGGHSLYVNGQRVGSTSARPGSAFCRPDAATRFFAPTDVIPIPTTVLTQGENVITLTNDADIYDSWSATALRLHLYGDISGPPVAVLKDIPLTPPTPRLASSTPISASFLLTSSYELAQGQVISQLVSYQIPGGYTDTVSVPLIIGCHGMGSSGQAMRDFLAPEANTRGWLLAAPDQHGMTDKNSGADALAWVGAQHDIIDTIEYMITHFNVDLARIYIVGESMGGQTTTVMMVKYPDVFAATAEWMGFTDLTDWYYDLDTDPSPWNLQDRVETETGGTPTTVSFEYQRRSAMEMPMNGWRLPLTIWHNVEDQIVPIYHSRDFRDVINDADPPNPVVLNEVFQLCPESYHHCYEPDLTELYGALADHTIDTQPPLSLTIRTDESKLYHWLDISQTGGDHWSKVDVAYSLNEKTVTATVSDTLPLTLALNLGSTPVTGPALVERPGMGLPATTYLIDADGQRRLVDYSTGFLTVPLTTTGHFSLTISAIRLTLAADPSLASGWLTSTTTISASVKDHLDNAVPDGTHIVFSTTVGTFPNAQQTFTTTLTGGQVTTTLTLLPLSDSSQVLASVASVTGSISVTTIYPNLALHLTAEPTMIYEGQLVTYTFQLTNTGDITLTQTTVTDDNGTPGDAGDDLTVCSGLTLAKNGTTTCQRSMALTQDTTIAATAIGQDPLNNDVTSEASTAVDVIRPEIALALTTYPTTTYVGEPVTYTYRLTNTGDVTLTQVSALDNNGTPSNYDDDLVVCTNLTLAAQETTTCRRGATLDGGKTNTATATGQDPLDGAVYDWASATVSVITPAVAIEIVPQPPLPYSGETVTFTFYLTNTGDVTLTQVTVTDDNGTPENTGDDVTVCSGLTLATENGTTCTRSATIGQDTTNRATVTAQDPLGGQVSAVGVTAVNVISPSVAIDIMPNRTLIFTTEVITYTVRLLNTGTITLTNVMVTDDNGTPDDGEDDVIVCHEPTLAVQAIAFCIRSTPVHGTITNTVTVVGQDPRGTQVMNRASTTVTLKTLDQFPFRIYLPVALRND